jgi:hypothetical protein
MVVEDDKIIGFTRQRDASHNEFTGDKVDQAFSSDHPSYGNKNQKNESSIDNSRQQQLFNEQDDLNKNIHQDQS